MFIDLLKIAVVFYYVSNCECDTVFDLYWV